MRPVLPPGNSLLDLHGAGYHKILVNDPGVDLHIIFAENAIRPSIKEVFTVTTVYYIHARHLVLSAYNYLSVIFILRLNTCIVAAVVH